jgi:hypothetical protein
MDRSFASVSQRVNRLISVIQLRSLQALSTQMGELSALHNNSLVEESNTIDTRINELFQTVLLMIQESRPDLEYLERIKMYVENPNIPLDELFPPELRNVGEPVPPANTVPIRVEQRLTQLEQRYPEALAAAVLGGKRRYRYTRRKYNRKYKNL